MLALEFKRLLKMYVGLGQKRIVITLLLVFLLLANSLRSSAQSSGGKLKGKNIEFGWEMTHRTSDGWSWTVEKWVGDDMPYHHLREVIDAQFANGANALAVVDSYHTRARKSQHDPQALFAWAYAAWKSLRLLNLEGQKMSVLWEIPDALANAKSPQVYDYDRMRFLIESHTGSSPHLKNIGARLLDFNPQDYEVSSEYAYTLLVCNTDESDNEAIAVYQTMLNSKDNTAKAYGGMACAYRDKYFRTHDRNFAHLAIEDFQQYLRLAQQNEFFRGTAEASIKVIQHEMAR